MLIKAVQSTEPWLKDPNLIPIPLQLPDISQRKLRVGIMSHDGVVTPHPPVLRALKLAKEKLGASQEVEVVDYVPYEHKEGYDIIVRRFNTQLLIRIDMQALPAWAILLRRWRDGSSMPQGRRRRHTTSKRMGNQSASHQEPHRNPVLGGTPVFLPDMRYFGLTGRV